MRITKPFYLGTYHVTRGQFRQFVKDTGYTTDAEKGDPINGTQRMAAQVTKSGRLIVCSFNYKCSKSVVGKQHYVNQILS